MSTVSVTRAALLRHRFGNQELHRATGDLASVADVAALDLGVQDTGPDGAAWALALRGAPLPTRDGWADGLALAWTLRGAPHAYRAADLDAVATATAPYSEADAAKRIFDASKPLREAGLSILDALRTVADTLRELVTEPTPKGDVSGALNRVLPEPFLRECRPCNAIHIYEQPFRLAALQAGLVLRPDTSPPVLEQVPGFDGPRYATAGGEADPRFDPIRAVLHLAPGSTQRDVTKVIDGAAADVKARWPDDVVEVRVEGEAPPRPAARRWALAGDAAALADAPEPADADEPTLRLLGPFDPYLQLQDRELLVPDEARRKDLWRVLGRPGGGVGDGGGVGTWRPRAGGKAFSVEVEPWAPLAKADRARIEAEAERLAAFRAKPLKAITVL